MPYIRQISHDESTGRLRKLLDEAVARAGRIWNIVGIMSVNAPAMDASMNGASPTGWGLRRKPSSKGGA